MMIQSVRCVAWKLLLVALALVLPAPVLAQHAGDILVASDGVRVMTSSYNGLVVASGRIFTSTLGDLGPSFPGRTSNPGVNAVASGVLPPGQVVGVSLTRALRKWDGTNFCSIPPETMQIRKSGQSVLSPAVDPVAGAVEIRLDIGVTGSDGFIHEHPAYWLQSPASSGIYLQELRVRIGSLQPSDSVWIMFNQNAGTPDWTAAQAWAASNVLASNPLVCTSCRADINNSGSVTVQDIFDFLSLWFANDARADINSAGGVSVQDVFDFLALWFSDC